jgi:hypothetical protein
LDFFALKGNSYIHWETVSKELSNQAFGKITEQLTKVCFIINEQA